jgi:hypothetical protein
MSDLLAELRSKWEEALASGTSDREWRAVALTIISPVKLLAGIRERDGRISVLVETALRHAPQHRVRFHAEGISLVDERSVEEGLIRLAITLERTDLRDIFEVLAVDLLAVASCGRSPESTVQQTVTRLEAWQVCLRARRRGLVREEQTGLLGELAVIELAAREIGLARAIAAWRGPMDGIHDFEAVGVALEVKASIGLSHHVRISRLDQLDSEGLGALLLLRVRFHEEPEGNTLPETIRLLRERIEGESPGAAVEFADKLMRTGYLDTDAEIYGSTRTVLDDIHGFRIHEEFPRLIRSTVPPAIVDAAYSLDEQLLAPFRLGEQELQVLLRRMGGQ